MLRHFERKVELEMQTGRFLIKTISSLSELQEAFLLRYQVFQVEMAGLPMKALEDHDEFDENSDHLAIFDRKSKKMVATCRLNSSLFSKQFYSAQEFECESLILRPEIKLEIGRVCVHKDFRKGVILMILWRAMADYMTKIEAKILFGCGSVTTENSEEVFLIYQHLKEEGKIRGEPPIQPTRKYRSESFDRLLASASKKLTTEQKTLAESLLPSLCKSYFDIGCYSPGPPAFDRAFHCIDFLTILESDELDPRMRQKMFSGES